MCSKKTIIQVFVLAAACAALLMAAPDFSGTWILDPSKSDQPGGRGGPG